MNRADRGGGSVLGGCPLGRTPGAGAKPLELDTYKHLIQPNRHRGFGPIAPPQTKGQKWT